MLNKQFPDGLCDQRVEFIPVEWRSSLRLDEGINQSGLSQSSFQLNVINKPKPNQLHTNWTTLPISNHSKIKTDIDPLHVLSHMVQNELCLDTSYTVGL